MNCALVLNLFEALGQTKTNTGRYDFNYVGQLYQKEGLLTTDLRLISNNLTDSTHSKRSRGSEQAKITLKNLLRTKEMGGHESLESVSAV